MNIEFKVDYRTSWGQTICICGSAPELGAWNENKCFRLNCYDFSKWSGILKLSKIPDKIEYYYLVKDGDAVVRREWGKPHFLSLTKGFSFRVNDYWQEMPSQSFLYTSPFTHSFFAHNVDRESQYFSKSVVVKVNCPYVKTGQELILCGESDLLGNWNPKDGLRLTALTSHDWQLIIDAAYLKTPLSYKLAIYDKLLKRIVHWEQGDNRWLNPFSSDLRNGVVRVTSINYSYGLINWKAAGVAIPVFSLRSKDSFGVGEFSDLKKMIDWAVATGQKFIQILPINDTSITYTWTDSYPYNSISIYALHPIYLGLKNFPLKDETKHKAYLQQAEKLNVLKDLNYEKVMVLKLAYFDDLFDEVGIKTLKSKSYQQFYSTNEDWLFSYACFCYLRDRFKTADFAAWNENAIYDRVSLEEQLKHDNAMQLIVDKVYFIQYLLHIQLTEVKEYAHKKGVVLKGDIPIGISRKSVEAWIEPHLFNMDTQTGAPPDDFSVNGQNWGFPTYNWNEMSKDGYRWWIRRFRKMNDYFDAYRIDHILGFFRIWEIPKHSVQGLLGYFNPALPYSEDEIRNGGMWFDEDRMTKPYIHEHFLARYFGKYVKDALDLYLEPIGWQRFRLKEFCNTQVKIQSLFSGKEDVKSSSVKSGLYKLCNEVLFIKDKREPNKYHPRISAQSTHSYNDLDQTAKSAYNQLYDNFFYYRHTNFWKEQALRKLPKLISSTDMLVCGEDLGMIPACVPDVMKSLQILSLEIQRMPKQHNTMFENLSTIPYLSVCTTSTHDMSPIRMWWNEDRKTTQKYYNEILWQKGTAPEDCTPDLCYYIVKNHIETKAMLVVLPLQDWLSIDGDVRCVNSDEERINIPANPHHYWRYRMHLYLEDLVKCDSLNQRIRSLLAEYGR